MQKNINSLLSMKKYTSAIIKSILLSLVFILMFNLNLQATTPTSDQTSLSFSSPESMTESYEIKPQSLFVQSVFAQDTPTPEEIEAARKKRAADRTKMIQDIAEAAGFIHRIFQPMINFFAFQTGNFLQTDYIFADAMGTMLKKIWTISRNLVNIIFVFILLGLALKEIFWLQDDGGSELKKSLLKFTLLLVAVNFSWLGTKVVLDAANIVTNAVFAIPMGVSSTGAQIIYQECKVENNKLTGLCYPSGIYAPVGSEGNKADYLHATECTTNNIKDAYSNKNDGPIGDGAFDGSTGEMNIFAADKNEQYKEKATFCWDTIDLAKYNANTSMIYLTYGMARIQNITKASADDSFTQLAVASLFSIVLQAAYTIALLALFIALVIRMAMLWLFVAFSPFLILSLHPDKVTEKLGSTVEQYFSLKKFVHWAFAPAAVGAVFTVAFLMISAGQTIGLGDASFFDELGKGGGTVSAELFKVDSLFMGMDTLQEFIWLLMTLIILWMGVFAVLSGLPVVNKITDRINSMGTTVATKLATSPYWAPIMPMVDPKTSKIKFGSYAKEFAMFNLPKQLEELQSKYTGAPQNLEKMEEKAGKFKDSDRKAVLAEFNKGNNGDVSKVLGLLGSSVGESKSLDAKAFTSLMNTAQMDNAGAIGTWMKGRVDNWGKSDAQKGAEKTEGAAAVAEGSKGVETAIKSEGAKTRAELDKAKPDTSTSDSK